MVNPMNDLQKLITLRRVHIKTMARSIGHGYHSVQKTIKGVRATRPVQEAVAAHLGLTWQQAFGPGRSAHLRRLILAEITKAGREKVKALQAQYFVSDTQNIAA